MSSLVGCGTSLEVLKKYKKCFDNFWLKQNLGLDPSWVGGRGYS
jgi:hypothetical protein